MPSQGPNSPGSTGFLDFGVTSVWSGVANITSSNDIYATVLLGDSTPDPTTSDWLNVYNFAFSIPTNATITGIVMTVEHKTSRVNGGYPFPYAWYLTSDGGATTIGVDTTTNASAALVEGVDTVGSSSDLWGATLTPAIVNSSNFGSMMRYSNNGGGGFSDFTVSVDHLTMTVHYTVPNILKQLLIHG